MDTYPLLGGWATGLELIKVPLRPAAAGNARPRCISMGSSPVPCKQRKEKSHPGWDDFSFSGASRRKRYH